MRNFGTPPRHARPRRRLLHRNAKCGIVHIAIVECEAGLRLRCERLCDLADCLRFANNDGERRWRDDPGFGKCDAWEQLGEVQRDVHIAERRPLSR